MRALIYKAIVLITSCWTLAGTSASTQAVSGVVGGRPPPSGERLFLQCRACHSLTNDQAGKVGPALAGLFTRGVGRAAGYDYSPGMRAFGGAWTDERLNAYLTGPNRVVAGTKMAFVGIPDAGRRAALIAYLRANTATTPPRK